MMVVVNAATLRDRITSLQDLISILFFQIQLSYERTNFTNASTCAGVTSVKTFV